MKVPAGLPGICDCGDETVDGAFSAGHGSRIMMAAMLAATTALAWVDARAATYPLPEQGQLIGEPSVVRSRYEDTLPDIGRRYGLGFEEMVHANPRVDTWLPGEGTEVRLPTRFILPDTPREGIVVNIAEFRLYYYAEADGRRVVSTFPISIGRMDWATPLGRWAVVSKQKDPTWYPPKSIKDEHLADGREPLEAAIPPGPDNPLGKYALRLSVGSYLIHGTNKPVGVGMQVTHGCIRMYPEDIEWLFSKVAVRTPVTIINKPYKFGWSGDDLYVEIHPPLDGDDTAAGREMTMITEEYVAVTRSRPARIDWSAVDEAYRRRDGIPVRVGRALDAGATRSVREDSGRVHPASGGAPRG